MSGNANTNFQQTKGQVLDVTSMTQFTATEKLITPDVVVPSGSGGVSTGQGPPGPPGPPGSTGLTGLAGVGINHILNNNNGTFTINLDNGVAFTTSNFTGPQGIRGATGPRGNIGPREPPEPRDSQALLDQMVPLEHQEHQEHKGKLVLLD